MFTSLPFGFLESKVFPLGSLGDLTIASGQTYNVAAGSILDYRNVTIQAGGTLNIQPSTSPLVTVLAVSGQLTIDGTITGVGGNFNDHEATIVTPTGETIVYTNEQLLGGKGGGSNGGLGTYGHGGGGRGGNSSYNSAGGGAGGSGGSAGGAGTNGSANGAGGTGMATLGAGANGTTSGNRYGARGANGGGSGGGGGGGAGGGDGGAGGGGGGHKGLHGLALYVYAENPIVGTGTINLNGQAGFRGGNGAGSGTRASYSGGGGAGGNGGKLWLRVPAEPSITCSVNPGAGGAGGTGGYAGGQAGPTGNPGMVDIKLI